MLDEGGARRAIHIPVERSLTVYIDRHELITLMTLGAAPELLVLGWLRNQGLLESVDAVESITVDWEVGAAAVRTHAGLPELRARTAQRTVTTGCGQGTVFGDLLGGLARVRLPAGPALSQAQLYAMLETMRAQDSIYKRAGSVHGCALFVDGELRYFIEDVGRHNAIDTIAGWQWMQPEPSPQGLPAFYTTGRLSSEMVIKAGLMGVPLIVSRNGITAMGQRLAEQLGLCLIGRAKGRHYLVYSGFERFAGPAGAPVPDCDS